MKEFLFSICFISLSNHLKLSIDIFIMSVRHVFTEFRFIFLLLLKTRHRKRIVFVLFYESTFCWYCEWTKIKLHPLQLWIMYYSYLYVQKWWRIYWKKMQVITLTSPCPEASPDKLLDIAHIYLGLTFKHCYMLELF